MAFCYAFDNLAFAELMTFTILPVRFVRGGMEGLDLLKLTRYLLVNL
jgi:hypothetical protein